MRTATWTTNSLHHALRQHRISNLQEARNVGASLQVRVVLLGRLARHRTPPMLTSVAFTLLHAKPAYTPQEQSVGAGGAGNLSMI